MSVGAAIGAALIAGGLSWALYGLLPNDRAGARAAEAARGAQGRMAGWLDGAALPETDPGSPAGRALQALLVEEAARASGTLDREQARAALQGRATSPLARAVLAGDLDRAVHLHLRRVYRGPRALFPIWAFAIARPRWGRRRLRLSALSAAIAELRIP